MNGFDLAILTWLNQFARRWYLFDAAVYHLAYFDLLKGTPFVIALTWLWASRGTSRARNREIVVATAAAAVCAIIVGRLVANGLPFRLRPAYRPDFHFLRPYNADGDLYRWWSAFPSDTAMVFSALATGLWFASRRLGVAAHAYAAVLIYFPRVYLGMHHPSDVLGGVALGILTAAVFNTESIRRRVAAWPLRMTETRPTGSALVAMFLALQLATMFDDARAVVRGGERIAAFALCRIRGGTNCGDADSDHGRAAGIAAERVRPAEADHVRPGQND